jgi:hypothetical protein
MPGCFVAGKCEELMSRLRANICIAPRAPSVMQAQLPSGRWHQLRAISNGEIARTSNVFNPRTRIHNRAAPSLS